MQEEVTGVHDNAAASATSIEDSSPHHQANRDDDVSGQSPAENEEGQENGNNEEVGNGGGYESLDAREVAEARMRAEQPAEYAELQAYIRGEELETPDGNGRGKEHGNSDEAGNEGGYEALDAREVAAARRRAQQPSEYERLPADTRREELGEKAGKKKAGNGEGYEVPDPREVAEAHKRAHEPAVYAGLQTDTMEDLYSLPKKKKNP